MPSSGVFVYAEPRSTIQIPRLCSPFPLRRHSSVRSNLPSSQNLQLSNLPTFKHALDPTLFSLFAPRAFHNSLAIKWFQTLSRNCRVSPPSLPSFLKSYLNSFCSQRTFPYKKLFCKSFVFCSLRTLPSSVSRNSFACHSYENCRVYTNSSHFGTQRPPLTAQNPLPTPHLPIKLGRLETRGYSFV